MYQPKFRITPRLLNLIDSAGALRAWINNAPLSVAWLPILQKEARARSAHSSTAIEGNPLSLAQVKAISRGDSIGAAQKPEKEVRNYLAAMRWIERDKKTGVKEKDLFSLHAIIMGGLIDGEKRGKYKEKQNYIVDENNIRIFTPPSPGDTPELVRDLITWLNTRRAKELHSVLVCAIFHHRFVSIHPFPDGNGRLARAAGTWILYQKGFDTKHIFSLDDHFAGDRKRYYLKLDQARQLDDDLTLWIEYVAEGIVKTLKNVKKRIEDLQVSSSYKLILSPGQEEVLRIFKDNYQLRGADFVKKLKVTRSRVNQLIAPLIHAGLVIKQGERKGTVYRLGL